MPKKKVNKKEEPKVSAMDIIFKECINDENMTKKCRDKMVKLLGMNEGNIHDSVCIEIIIDLLRYLKDELKVSTQIGTKIYKYFIEFFYYISNAKNISKEVLQLNLKYGFEWEKIDKNIIDSVTSWVNKRIFSNYNVYRYGLYHKNPINIIYNDFKTKYKINELIMFEDIEYPLKMIQFKQNYILCEITKIDIKPPTNQENNETNVDVNEAKKDKPQDTTETDEDGNLFENVRCIISKYQVHLIKKYDPSLVQPSNDEINKENNDTQAN